MLRPGGVLIGSDSLASNDLHHFHAGDTYNPVDPAWLLGRLQTVGFDEITIIVDGTLKFVARRASGRARSLRRRIRDGGSGMPGVQDLKACSSACSPVAPAAEAAQGAARPLGWRGPGHPAPARSSAAM